MPGVFGGKVHTGYVSGTMRSMLPQHRKKKGEQEMRCPQDDYVPGKWDSGRLIRI